MDGMLQNQPTTTIYLNFKRYFKGNELMTHFKLNI